jgi:hypothetical protein
VDTSHRELEPGPAGARGGLLLQIAPAFATVDHGATRMKEEGVRSKEVHDEGGAGQGQRERQRERESAGKLTVSSSLSLQPSRTAS